MGTTLTLDDDVSVKRDGIREGRGATLEEVVSDALRIGLRKMDRSSA